MHANFFSGWFELDFLVIKIFSVFLFALSFFFPLVAVLRQE